MKVQLNHSLKFSSNAGGSRGTENDPACGARPQRPSIARFVNNLVCKIGWLGVLALMLAGTGQAQAQVIRLISAPGKFYVDDKSSNGIVFNYAAYMVSNNTPSNIVSTYVALTNLISTNLIRLAPNDTGTRQLGPLAPGESKMAAFYLKGPSFTKGADSLSGLTNENHTIRVLNGPPGIGSVLSSSNFGFTNIEFVIEAAANKVRIITNLNPFAVLGTEVALVIAGDTGTIGGQNSIAFSPAVLGNWRPDAYQLVRTIVDFEENPTFTNQLYFDPSYPGFTNFTGQAYTNTFVFRAIKVTGTNVAISPFGFVDSGSGTKHTDLTSLGSVIGTNIIVSATNLVTIINHTVTPTSLLAPGGTVTYSITFSNSSKININLDEIVDTLPGVPANFSFVPGSATFNSAPLVNPSISGQTLRWPLPLQVASSNTSVLTFQATTPLPGGVYTNRVIGIIGGEQIDTTTITTDNNVSTSVFSLIPISDIAVSKAGPASVLASTNFNYTITVTNLGPNSSASLSVTDALPASVSFVSASSGGFFSGGKAIWTNLPGIAANTSTTLTVTVTAPAFNQMLSNSASGGSTNLDFNPTNNVSAPVFTSVMGVNIPPVANNDSTNTAVNTPVNIAATANDTDVNGDSLTITLVSPTNGTAIIVGGGTSISFTPATNFNGTATIGYTISDGNGGTATAVITVNVSASADLAVGKSGPPAIFAGTNFDYTITVTNLGPTVAASLSVIDNLPAGVTFVSASSGGVLNSNQVVWTNLGSLAAGTTTNLTLTVTAPADGASLTNVVNANSPTPDPNPTNNTSPPVFTSVTPVADVGVSKSGPAVSVLPGANFDYTITVTNSGPSTALTVTLTDNLPASLTFVSATGGGVLNGSDVIWTNIGDLASGTATNFILTVTAPLSGSVTNVATVTSPTTDTNTLNNSTPPVTTVVSNLAPVAGDDSATTPKNVSVSVPVLANDSDANADVLTIDLVSPTNGTAMISGTNVLFTPASNFVGTATIGYTISDGHGGTTTGLITVTVFNTAPVAGDDSYTTAEDVTLTVLAISGVLTNDTDVDGDTLSAILVTGPLHGALTLNPNGGFTYTPTNDYNGADNFTYRANDGLASSAIATVSLTVTSVNDAPVVALAIPNQAGTYGSNFSYTFPTNTFSDVDSGQTLTFAATNLPPGIAFNPATRTFSGTPTAAGTFTVTVTATDDGTPALGVSDTFDIVVAKVALSVTAGSTSRPFAQTNPPFTFAFSGFVLGDTTNAVSGSPSLSTLANNSSPIGTYAISVGAGSLAASNYSFTLVDGVLTVTVATPDTAWAPQGPITYGSPLTTNQLNATSSVAGIFTYAPSNGVFLNAGTNTLTAVFTPTDTNNYSPANLSAPLVVLPALLGVTADNQSRLYATTNPTLTHTLSGFVNGDTAGSALAGSPSVSTLADSNSPVGSYTIAISAGTLSASNYVFALTNGLLAVTPATPVVTWTPQGPITYGMPLTTNQLNATPSVPGVFTYTPTNGVVLPVGTNGLTTVFTPNDTNYLTITNIASIVVLPANLNVTADNKVRGYGEANPTFTYTLNGFVNGENSGVVSGVPSLNTVANSGSPVGAYQILVGAGTLGAANYAFTLINGTLTVTSTVPSVGWAPQGPITYGMPLTTNQLNATSSVAGVFTYAPSNGVVLNAGTNILATVFTPTDTNYTPVNLSTPLVVLPATLSVTANEKSRIYGTANPALTYTLSGFVNGDTTNAISGAPVLSTVATLSSSVGMYPITVAPGTLAANNYVFSLMDSTLTITIATPPLTWTTPIDIVYGTPLGTNQLNATSPVPGVLTYTPSNSVVLPAGSNTLIVVFDPIDPTNYTSVTSSVPLIVLKAPLTITANDLSRPLGATNPPLTYSFSGFVNGEDPSAITGAPVLSTTATPASPSGTYPITITTGTLAAANYAFTLTGGTLTVIAGPDFGLLAGPITFNPQTGLFEQLVTVTNTGGATAAGHRVNVDGLRTGVKLYNATGTNTGVPFVQFNSPLDPGATNRFRLEFFVPDRLPFTDTLTVEMFLPINGTNVAGSGVLIDRCFMDQRLPDEPRLVIEFNSLPGRIYTIIYSDDGMATWKAATPSIVAGGTRTQWYDDGPPKTDSKPGMSPTRFYQVILAPIGN